MWHKMWNIIPELKKLHLNKVRVLAKCPLSFNGVFITLLFHEGNARMSCKRLHCLYALTHLFIFHTFETRKLIANSNCS